MKWKFLAHLNMTNKDILRYAPQRRPEFNRYAVKEHVRVLFLQYFYRYAIIFSKKKSN